MKPTHVLSVCIAVLLLTGCKQKNAEPTMAADSSDPPATSLTELDAPPPERTTYANDPYARDLLIQHDDRPLDAGAAARPASKPEPESTLIGGTDTGGRTHVVQKGDTLFRLARHYYSDERRWKDIWDANRVRIADPDRIEVGTRLIIP